MSWKINTAGGVPPRTRSSKTNNSNELKVVRAPPACVVYEVYTREAKHQRGWNIKSLFILLTTYKHFYRSTLKKEAALRLLVHFYSSNIVVLLPQNNKTTSNQLPSASSAPHPLFFSFIHHSH